MNIRNIIILSLFFCFLSACDVTSPMLINGELMYINKTDNGNVVFRGEYLGSIRYFNIKCDGTFLINPDSLKIDFYHKKGLIHLDSCASFTNDELEKMAAGKKYNKMINATTIKDPEFITYFYLSNMPNPIFNDFEMRILPCKYIMHNGESVIKDTLRIEFSNNKIRKLYLKNVTHKQPNR